MKTKDNYTRKSTLVLTPVIAKSQIDRINKRISSELYELRDEHKSLPEGKLYIRYRGDLVLFTERCKGKLFGITRNRDLVHKLARREYLQLQMAFIDEILEEGWTPRTEKVIARLYPQIETLLKKYEDAGLDIDQITMTPNQRIWNSDRHSQKENRREELIYPTRGGVYMRTQSERFIGDLLERLHIPYRYETRVTINNRAYHPDFIIMLPDGRLVILEHVGRMDLREYDEDLITRLQAYDSIGLMIGRNVFMTFHHDIWEETRVKEVLFQVLTASPPWNKTLVSVARKAGCQIEQPAYGS